MTLWLVVAVLANCHASERDECLTFAGLVPLLLSDIRKEWSNIITCTDASPMGFGICERHSNIETVRKHGRVD